MTKYIIKRILTSIFILLGVSVLLYVLVRCMPVDYVRNKITEMQAHSGANIDQTVIDNMYKMYGLNNEGGLWGILQGYWTWLCQLATFDLGTRFENGRPVLGEIVDHMGTSFIISAVSVVFEFMIAIPLGITAATHQYSLRDYIVTILVMIGISLPSFFFGQVLKDIFANKLAWFPVQGMGSAGKDLHGFEFFMDYLWHMVLPVLTVVILSIGARMRMTRTNMLEVLNADYIRTARAKGLPEGKVIYKHAFRNTLIPLVTDLAGLLPGLFSGAMITETVFGIDGIGRIALEAMQQNDIPFVMGYNMFLAFLSVVGILLADLMYAVVDPRVKLA